MLASSASSSDTGQDTVTILDTVHFNGEIKKEEDEVAVGSHQLLCAETGAETGIYTTMLASSASSSDTGQETVTNLDTVRVSGDIKRKEDEVAGNFTGSHPLSCTETGCGKHFGRLDHLKRHMLIHTGQMIKCSYVSCTRVFRDKYELRMHTESVHEQAEPYACSEQGCDQKFKTTTARQRHLMESHAKIVHQCPCCAKTFLQKHLLDGHMTKHTGLKNYACNDCQKRFAFKHNLVAHMKNKSCSKSANAKIAHFFCDQVGCGKGYADKRCLKRHFAAAHSSIVFQCDKCNKVLSYASGLSRHRLTCN